MRTPRSQTRFRLLHAGRLRSAFADRFLLHAKNRPHCASSRLLTRAAPHIAGGVRGIKAIFPPTMALARACRFFPHRLGRHGVLLMSVPARGCPRGATAAIADVLLIYPKSRAFFIGERRSVRLSALSPAGAHLDAHARKHRFSTKKRFNCRRMARIYVLPLPKTNIVR